MHSKYQGDEALLLQGSDLGATVTNLHLWKIEES